MQANSIIFPQYLAFDRGSNINLQLGLILPTPVLYLGFPELQTGSDGERDYLKWYLENKRTKGEYIRIEPWAPENS